MNVSHFMSITLFKKNFPTIVELYSTVLSFRSHICDRRNTFRGRIKIFGIGTTSPTNQPSMDQIFIKTRLKEFIDWRYSQSCWHFRPLLWTSASLTFSLVHLPPYPPPFPVWISTRVCIHTVCKGGGIGGLRQINTCRQVLYLYWSILKKMRHLGFRDFIDIWSLQPRKDPLHLYSVSPHLPQYQQSAGATPLLPLCLQPSRPD